MADEIENRMLQVVDDLTGRHRDAAQQLGGVDVFITRRAGTGFRREQGIAAVIGARDVYEGVRWRLLPFGRWHDLQTPEEAANSVAVAIDRIVAEGA